MSPNDCFDSNMFNGLKERQGAIKPRKNGQSFRRGMFVEIGGIKESIDSH